jgi:hypothetical protein
MNTEQQLKESFKSISDSLNTTFSFGENDDTDKKLQVFEEKKNELMALDVKKEVKTIEDKEFIDFTIKKMIDIGITVLETAAKDIKIGSKFGKIEEFSEAFRSVLESIKELKVFKKMIFDMNLDEPTTNPKNVTINNIFTSGELLREIDNDKNKSSI